MKRYRVGPIPWGALAWIVLILLAWVLAYATNLFTRDGPFQL